MRLIRVAALSLGALVSACAAVSGLNNYSAQAEDAWAPLEAGMDDGRGGGTDSPLGDEPPPSGDDSSSSSGGDAGPGTDANGGRPDAGHTDAAPEQPCGPSNCQTCCVLDAGSSYCVKANANSACGNTGGSCTDCTKSGKICSSGACINTACVASSCKACTPYFVPCCKADSTCGCSLLFPPGPCT